jgi:hypothetical protein
VVTTFHGPRNFEINHFFAVANIAGFRPLSSLGGANTSYIKKNLPLRNQEILHNVPYPGFQDSCRSPIGYGLYGLYVLYFPSNKTGNKEEQFILPEDSDSRKQQEKKKRYTFPELKSSIN